MDDGVISSHPILDNLDADPPSTTTPPVRVITIDGEPWFVGKEICDVLGYKNATDAMNQHCKGVAKRYPLQTKGGMQETRIINEPDMLRLIVSSQLPAAVRFEAWVFEDVLPTIRKTGTTSPASNTAHTREPEPAGIFKNCLQIAYSTPTKKKPR